MAVFKPLRVGRVELAHRIALAPLTRFRADDEHVPLPFVEEYYAQRAAVPNTLLITEATLVSNEAGQYANVPGIYTPAQIAAWRRVTDRVHAQGSYIYLQLWALGRTANLAQLKKDLGRDDVQLVSSSPLALDDDHETPRPLTEPEIQKFIQDYAVAARNAVELAGFDGVEIHGANGYLIDQFTSEAVNQRSDRWGGSIENRARFALEIVRAVVDAVGADRTAIRFSPFNEFQGVRVKDPRPQFTYLAEQLAPLKLAYVHLLEPRSQLNTVVETNESLDFFLDAYGKAGPVVLAGGYTAENTVAEVEARFKRGQDNILVAFGRWFISNPDLPFRIQHGIPLTPYNRDTFYLRKSEVGYIDYPFSEQFTAKYPLAVKAKA